MKKKAIKIATASAIAASGFVAVAPTQSEAAPNVKAEVSRAKTVMYNAMYAYSKPFVATGEMVDQAVVYAAYKKGEAQYKYAVSVVNKYAPAKEKAALLADLDKVRKNYLLGRALNYIKAFNALELHVEKAAKELEAALATNDEAKIKEAKANLEKVYEAQKADLNKVVESSIKAHVNESAATVVETAKAAAEKKLEEIAVPKVVEVSAINAKTLKVTLNKELENLDGLTFTVKRGTTSVVLSAKLGEDKKSVELSSTTNLVPGDYTVTVTGGKFVEGSNSGTVTVEAQKVASIELKSTNLVLASGTTPQTGTVGYVVKDQYGTDITKEALAANITWTSSVGTATDNNEGVLTVNKGVEIKVGDTIVVTGVDAASGKTVTATLKAVDAAALKEVTFGDLKLPTNKTRVEIGLANAAEVAVTAKDQYGNDITTASAINAATQIVVSDPAVQATWVDVDNKPYLRLNTSGLTTAKKVTVTVVIKATGQSVQYTFDVVKPSEAAEISATAPTNVIAAGDAAGKVVVPLVVKDQFGKELTLDEIAANAGGITITSSNSSVLQSTDLQIATTGDNKGKLVNINPVRGEGKTVITLTVNATGKSVSFELEAKAARKLSTIEFPTDLATFLIQGAQTTTQLKYKDQYGADFDATSDVTNHKIVLEVSKVSGDDNGLTVTPNGNVDDESTLDTTNAITINAAAGKKGTYTLSAKLVNTTTNEVVSQATKTFTVGENSSTGLTYSVGEIGKIFKDSVNRGSSQTAIDANEIALGYAKEIKITAKDASGNSYVIPQSEILSISVDKPSVATVGQVNGKWYIAGGNTTAGSDNVTDDTTVNFSVVINTKEGVKTITQPVVVSKEDLTPTEIKLLDKAITDTTAKAVTDLTFTDLADLRSGKTAYAYVVDQFGGIGLDFTATTDEKVANMDGLTLANGDSVVVTGNKLVLTPGTVGTAITKANATFRYVAYTANGKTAAINVKVTNASNIAGTGVTLGATAETQKGNPGDPNATPAVPETKEVATTTVTAGATASGTITVRVTDGTLSEDVPVNVVAGDTAADVASKIRTALAANANVDAAYEVSGTGADIVLTQKGTGSDVNLQVTLQ